MQQEKHIPLLWNPNNMYWNTLEHILRHDSNKKNDVYGIKGMNCREEGMQAGKMCWWWQRVRLDLSQGKVTWEAVLKANWFLLQKLGHLFPSFELWGYPKGKMFEKKIRSSRNQIQFPSAQHLHQKMLKNGLVPVLSNANDNFQDKRTWI